MIFRVTAFASLALLISFHPGAHGASSSASQDDPIYREWIEAMKHNPRGPFSRIRWFCHDGTVLPPQAYACEPHGGGVQHGEWTEQVLTLRDNGYYIANVLADLDEQTFTQSDSHKDQFNQILIEQFLIAFDDGWILRKARAYRGALQDEDERRGARRLLTRLAGEQTWLTRDYVVLRIGARLLSHGEETASVTKVRQLSANLSQKDDDFSTIRNKIHVRPEPGDAATVRAYAGKTTDQTLVEEYEQLAQLIDKVYARTSNVEGLRRLAKSAKNDRVATVLNTSADALAGVETDPRRLAVLGDVMASVRDTLTEKPDGEFALQTIDLNLRLEDEFFALGAKLTASIDDTNRSQRLDWLRAGVQALYGAGLIRQRQRDALDNQLSRLSGDTAALSAYKSALDYLGLTPGWGAQRLRFHFFDSMTRLATIEPHSALFIQDQLRGSPLFFFANVLDGLLRDANQLAGVKNELFGEEVGGGLRALNPGLARGELILGEKTSIADYRADGIYLLPETISDLPPVAGILTAGAGNPLSHVQLLARNLGIPNVGVDESLRPRLLSMQGKPVVLAVSSAGTVRLMADTDEFAALFKEEQAGEQTLLISPDLEKLDLNHKDFVRLSQLRATDSGRIVGPKAAKLGELYHHYPEAVAEGLTIPFGIFKDLLSQPYGDTGKSVFDWMVERYRYFETLPAGSSTRVDATEAFRESLYQWILSADPGDTFRDSLTQAMQETFGIDGSYGVFVRSDTNVEDLPGFTGAGLNLTVANVVGVKQILAAIPRVWASPFTARAFAWRQSHMDQPEHVYPAVLLMRSVPSEKSGVLVTQDVDTGNPRVLSIAVNEGVGGAVDGQAAESLRVDIDTGEVSLLAEATAPIRRAINPAGGVDKLPVSDREAVLSESEIGALIKLAKELPERFPTIVDAEGNTAPTDIEFGFLQGELRLFQIRPFLESSRARGSQYLKSLDSNIHDLDTITVSLSSKPGSMQ